MACCRPGSRRLARHVAQVRDEATQRLWDTLYALLTAQQRGMLERLLGVPKARVSALGVVAPGTAEPSGRNSEKALTRVSEITAVGSGRWT